MSKSEFIRLWAIQFSAAYVVSRYADMGRNGWKPSVDEVVGRAILVEDAVMMAEIAWERFCTLAPTLFGDAATP